MRRDRLPSKSIEMRESLGVEQQSARYVAMRGFVEHLEGEIELAESYFQNCMLLAEKYSDERSRSLALSGIGSIFGDRKDFSRADQYKRKSLEILRSFGDRYLVGLNSWSIAGAAVKSGHVDEASSLYRECAEIALELGNRSILPHLFEGVGNVACLRNDYSRGLIVYAVASVLRERLGLAFAPTDEVDYRKAIQRFRAELGDSEYQKLWYNGRQLSLKTAVQLAFPGMETD